MRLSDIRDTIINSETEDWHSIPAGAYFTDAPNIDTDSFEQHDSLLVYRDDVSLTVQWGMRARGYDHVQEVQQIWPSAAYPDPSVRVFHIDVFWCGVLVDRESLVSVDGGRAYLPIGSKRCTNWQGFGHPKPETYEFDYTATAWQTGLARLIASNSELDSYMARAHVIIRD
ncbi:hypothetical protein [Miniimonas sp. S16]|uniref:hypothetical protein n=1 Tax=Miniimonas sp. S16 TaxID=2171623 RepID=UPI00131F32B7|nr:hypothetical protein [Miniimonas sp. S16]